MFRLPVSYRVFRSPPDPRDRAKITRSWTYCSRTDWASRLYKHFPTEKRIIAFTVPQDSEVREVATIAVQTCRKSAPLIPRFDRAVRTYCGMIMGYHDRHTVVEYMYRQLCTIVETHRVRRRTLTRKTLEDEAVLVFGHIEESIKRMASSGRVLENGTTRRGCINVIGNMTERKGQCFLTLGWPNQFGLRPILALQTKGRYGRTMRRRFKQNHQEYRNYHPMSRH